MFIYSFIAISLMIIGVILPLIFLNNKKQLSMKIVDAIAWTIFIYKIGYYFVHLVIMKEGVLAVPVEMSAVLYFVFPIGVLTRSKILKEYAIVGAFLAGMVEMVAAIALPSAFLIEQSPISFVESIFLHGLLFTGGFIYIARIEGLKLKDVWKFTLGAMITTSWAAVANATFRKGGNVMFLDVNILPFKILGGHFYYDYLFLLIIFLAITYLTSYLGMKKQHKVKVDFFK